MFIRKNKTTEKLIERRQQKVKKPFKFTEMSDTVCLFPNCTKHIKLNVLVRKPSVNICYRHYILKKKRVARKRR